MRVLSSSYNLFPFHWLSAVGGERISVDVSVSDTLDVRSVIGRVCAGGTDMDVVTDEEEHVNRSHFIVNRASPLVGLTFYLEMVC